MKKIISIAILFATPILVNAQSDDPTMIDKDLIKIGISIFVMGLLMMFILVILKLILDYRLKNKIIENAIPENIASTILQTNLKENRNNNLKWFAIMVGLGIGFTIIKYTFPIGIHSLAIMAFCLAGSFLAYFYFSKQSKS